MSKGHFEFHLCHEEPNSGRVIGFEIYFVWRSPLICYSVPDRKKGGHRHGDLCINVESLLCDEDWATVPLFRVWYGAGSRCITLRDRHRQFRAPVLSQGSGGNWYWEVFTTDIKHWSTLMNWLRRSGRLYVSEWATDFWSSIWNRRGPIRLEHLREFHRRTVQSAMRRHREEYPETAKDTGVTIPE